MLKLSHSINAPKMRSGEAGDIPATTLDLDNILVSGAFVAEVEIADGLYRRSQADQYYTGGWITQHGLPAMYESLDPEVATISNSGEIIRLSAGMCRVRITTHVVNKVVTLDLHDKTDNRTIDEHLNPVAGSLAAHMIDAVDSRINGSMTMALNGFIYTSQDHSNSTYVRNMDAWCSGANPLDLSCISPWNSLGGVRRAGTLVTPRHVLHAKHYPLYVGNTVRFVAMDNTVHDRIITGVTNPPIDDTRSDFRIATLDSDLPASIKPCSVVSPLIAEKCVNNLHNDIPCLVLDQEEKALIAAWRDEGSFTMPRDDTRLIFREEIISGDSGNPSFMIINDELVLVTVWTRGASGTGYPTYLYIPELNDMIAASDAQAGVSTGYTLTEADFTAFPTF